jgi:hypothetical protein
MSDWGLPDLQAVVLAGFQAEELAMVRSDSICQFLEMSSVMGRAFHTCSIPCLSCCSRACYHVWRCVHLACAQRPSGGPSQCILPVPPRKLPALLVIV